MKRRHFLLLLLSTPLLRAQQRQRDDAEGTITRFIFARMMQKAVAERWATLPIGECMCRFGELFVGTLYATGTLESSNGMETCRVDFTGMDCFTLVEATLCLARALKLGKPSYEGFVEEVLRTRYRNGQMIDYTSRLHYTADWFHDNERRGILRNITRDLGGIPISITVSYMSQNPHRYPALRIHPEWLHRIAEIEHQVNSRQHWYIPRKTVPAVLGRLQPGDIIAFTTSRRGLDYGHIGLAYPSDSSIYLLHASQNARRVLVDKPIEQYLATTPTHTGIAVARAL
ncbi:MAG: DUF1460 domain-containing protein, partial [Candidatus Kapabacteria bacterium]|nr:DUF1460 domain-containing protein [Candidatus Kapabacteria bacterium]MDW7997502.1 DUF1460 domain-containing protein [Bacteroidota bacterium]